jgi:hypothetical protein
MDDESMINGGQGLHAQERGLALIYTAWQSCELEVGSSFMKSARVPISHLVHASRLPDLGHPVRPD